MELNHLEQSYIRDAVARNDFDRFVSYVEEYGIDAVRKVTASLLRGDDFLEKAEQFLRISSSHQQES